MGMIIMNNINIGNAGELERREFTVTYMAIWYR